MNRISALLLSLMVAACHRSGKKPVTAAEGPMTTKELKELLGKISIRDQAARQELEGYLDTITNIDSSVVKKLYVEIGHGDSVNQRLVCRLLDTGGWPKADSMGIDGSETV